MKVRTYIVLVNWNGGEDTLECLESLLQLEDPDFRVVVVDNGSMDGSVDLITKWAARKDSKYPHSNNEESANDSIFLTVISGSEIKCAPHSKITIIDANSNIGFAAANNLGMRFASGDAGATYFWILNNDTTVDSKALTRQVASMNDDPTIGMLGARLMFYYSPEEVQGLAGGFHLNRARGYHIGLGLQKADLPAIRDVEGQMSYVLGASMFVPRSLFDEVGGMSEAYFLYFEELDWARRMPSHLRLASAPDAVVWHKEGGSIGSSTKGRPSDTSIYYMNASLLRFYAKHHRLLLPIALARVLREASKYGIKGDRQGVASALRALIDVLMQRSRRGKYGSTEFFSRQAKP